MFSEELRNLLVQVVTSWQVIAVSIALVLYIFLINYVSSSYHQPRIISKSQSKPRKMKGKHGPKEVSDSLDPNDELGLEEA